MPITHKISTLTEVSRFSKRGNIQRKAAGIIAAPNAYCVFMINKLGSIQNIKLENAQADVMKEKIAKEIWARFLGSLRRTSDPRIKLAITVTKVRVFPILDVII